MLKNYFTTALRNLRKHPGFTALNIVGLATGLACGLLILLFVQDERSFDRFHEKADRIYRLEMDMPGPDGETQRWSRAYLPLGNEATVRLPEVEATLRMTEKTNPLVVREDLRFYEDHFLHAEPSFFTLFDFTLSRGSAEDLARPFTLVLTESMATKYFPDTDPIGQTLQVQGRYDDTIGMYEVVGVMPDLPHNIHFRADFLASHASVFPEEINEHWFRINYTYLLLRPGTTPEALAAKFQEFLRVVLPERLQQHGATLQLMPLTDIHLRGVAESDLAPQGDIRYVWLFSAIAVLILLIAGINYVNLATARATRRAREVGVRKVVGAHRRQLLLQFIGESLLLTGAALVLGLGLAQLLLPAFEALMERPLDLPFDEPWLWGALAAAVLVIGVGAGSYPAFVLSSFRPTAVLKGSVRMASRTTLRQALVVFQFVATVALIACTIGIHRQLHYVQNTRLGFDKEQVLVINTRDALGTQGSAFRQALAQISGVQQAALASSIPGDPTAITFFLPKDVEGQEDSEATHFGFDAFWVGAEFVPTLGIELVEGRNFSEEHPADAESALLINETAARELGWDAPLGKTIRFRNGPKQVVGVLRDFHINDMKKEIGPVLLQYHPTRSSFALVRFTPTDLPTLLTSLDAAWTQFVPGQPMDYFFLDEHFAAMYRAEQQLGKLFLAFALLAVVVACLGLFGLAAFTAEQRTKEIGIRKVLGARVSGLVALLSKDLLKLVLVAFVIAAPLAYLLLQTWLSSFVYRASIGFETLLLAGGLALLIALLTVSTQAWRTATSDPVKALRYE